MVAQMVPHDTLENLSALSDQGVPLLGILVNLEISGYLPDTVVQAELGAQFGYGSDGRALYAPRPTTPADALQRAIYELPGPRPDKVTSPAGQPGTFDITIIPYVAGHPAPQVKFRARVQTDEYGHRVFVDGANAAPYLLKLQQGMERHLTLQKGADVARALTEGLIRGQMDGVAWRRRGGIYFVPNSPHHFALLDQLITAVEGRVEHDAHAGHPRMVGGFRNGATVELSGSFDNQLFRARAAAILHRAVMDEVKQLTDGVTELLADKKAGKKVTGARVVGLQEAFKTIYARARTYQQILDLNTRDITAQLSQAEQTMLRFLGLPHAAPPAP